MRAFRWMIITGAAVVGLLLLAIAVGAVWLNSFIHSAAFREEIEKRAGQSLGGTVQIRKIDFDIWHGVKLQGLLTQIDLGRIGGKGTVMVNVSNVSCSYAWSELFNRRLKLTGVTLDEPRFVLTRQPTSPMPTNEAATSGTPSGQTNSEKPVSATSPATSTTPSGPLPETMPTQASAMPFQFVLDEGRINNGAISVHDSSGASVVELQGVNLKSDTSGYYEEKDVTGTLQITSAALPWNVLVKDFSTPFTYRTGNFTAKPFGAAAFGGRVAGDYQLDGSEASILDVNATGLDLAQILSATAPGSSVTLSGSFNVQSKWRGVELGTVNGEGDAQLTNGKLEGVKILHDLSNLLKVKELNEPAVSKAQTHFELTDRGTQLTGLQIDSTGFRMTGGGEVGFDGSLNLDMVLLLTKDVMGRMPKELAASFVLQPDGTGSIGFRITGTEANPQTDLPERLLLQNTQIKNVIDKALNKFFH